MILLFDSHDVKLLNVINIKCVEWNREQEEATKKQSGLSRNFPTNKRHKTEITTHTKKSTTQLSETVRGNKSEKRAHQMLLFFRVSALISIHSLPFLLHFSFPFFLFNIFFLPLSSVRCTLILSSRHAACAFHEKSVWSVPIRHLKMCIHRNSTGNAI